MPDWKSRLAASYKDESGNEVTITPIDSFSPSFSLNTEVIHSLERTHVGLVYLPQSISFTMSVRAIGPVAAQLTAMALGGQRFELRLQETDDGNDWAFTKIVLANCIITNASPSNATASGAPTATFSGISLGASSEGKTVPIASIP
ncbi:MAG: hypothetical protein ABMB14_31510 [Myxococcota bacterium]